MIYIWVRRTTDWEDEQAFLAQLEPAFKQRVDAWNTTFTIPYHLFRAEVKRIAGLNLSRVENSACLGWDEIPKGGLVVPVDDDDWFAPNLAAVLEEHHHPEAAGYHWTRTFIEVPLHFRHRLGLLRRRAFPGTPPKFFCASNNYGMVKRTAAKPLLENHIRAGEWFEPRDGGAVRKIERRLSAMNRTLASQTTMRVGRRSITRAQLLRKYRGHTRLYGELTDPELAWCRPYMAMMSDLMGRLEIRDRR